jgi:hypothetical protein
MAISIDISKLYWTDNANGSVTCHSNPFSKIREWLVERGVQSFGIEEVFNPGRRDTKILKLYEQDIDVAVEFKLTWLS